MTHRPAALALCRKLDWLGYLIEGHTKTGSVFVFLPYDLQLAMRNRGNSEEVIDLNRPDSELLAHN